MLKILFKLVRPALGKLLLFGEKVFSPKPMIQRSSEVQLQVDSSLDKLALFEFLTCPFCVKVRMEMKRLGIDIKRLDARNDESVRNELLTEGGKVQVPCLRLPGQGPEGKDLYMYESDAIIKHLQSQFS